MRKLVPLFLGLCCSSAWAIPVTWTLDSAIFDDGGSLTGSFVYDADTSTFSDLYIEAGPSEIPPPLPYGYLFSGAIVYQSPYQPQSGSSDGLFAKRYETFTCGPFLCDRELTLLFAYSLTNSGGTVSLDLASFERSEPAGTYLDRHLAGGSLVGVAAVPVPTALWLFVSAFAGLGWLKRGQMV